VIDMDQIYWLGRTRAATAMARKAAGAEARLAHLELAGRYSIKAATAAAVARKRAPAQAEQPRLAAPSADPLGYDQLEEGARYLAGKAAGDGERRRHLGMANRYAQMAQDEIDHEGR
jgi:hypothetical protein